MALESHDTMVPSHEYANIGNDTAKWDDGWFSDTIHAYKFVGVVLVVDTLEVDGFVTTDDGHMQGDNTKLYFGADDDASIYYDGSNLQIDPQENGSGSTCFPNGHLQVGRTTPSLARLQVNDTQTDTSKLHIGFQSVSSFGSGTSGDTTNPIYSGAFEVQTGVGYVDDVSALRGIRGSVNHWGTGTIGSAYAMSYYIANRDSGTITNAIGIEVNPATNYGAGTFTNVYGLIISSVNVGTNLNYAIYTSDGLSHFGDNVEIIGNLEVQGEVDINTTTGALIVPRMTTTQRNALTPINGMIVYDTSLTAFYFYENGGWVTK